MTLLQQIKQGNCYIRTETDHDLALVINYCHDKKIGWRCEKAIEYPTFKGRLPVAVCFEIEREKTIMCWCIGFEFIEHYTDITDQFFSEIAK